MTPFSLEVRFSGVCHFGPPFTAEDKSGKFTKVLFPKSGTHSQAPDYSQEKWRALDKQKLERHVAFLAFDPRDVVDARSPESHLDAAGLVYIDGYDISFDITYHIDKETSDAGHELRPRFAPQPTNELLRYKTSYRDYLAPLDKVAGKYYHIDKTSLVGSTVTIKDEDIYASHYDVEWKINKRLSGSETKRFCAQEIIWCDGYITSLKIRGRSRDQSGKKINLELRPGRQDHPVKLSFLTYSVGNPLEWARKRTLSPDKDFRWYYQLMSEGQRKKIKKKLHPWYLRILWLKPYSLPIPKPIKFFGVHFKLLPLALFWHKHFGKRKNYEDLDFAKKSIRGSNCLPSGG